MKSGALLFALCASLHAQDASLAGVTVDSSTGRPLPGVHVLVFTMAANDSMTPYGARSDNAGRFSIAKIPPGSYVCLGERTGYLTINKGGGVPPSVILKAGERLAEHKVEMVPRATVSGRVLDEFGDPVQYAQVLLTPASSGDPVAFSFTGNAAQTDDRGEYRLPAAPGKYRVRAVVYQQTTRPAEIRTDGTSPASYLPTSYPDVVEVAAGAEVNGIDIRLGSRAAPVSAVDGTVTGIPDSRGWADVYLVARDSPIRQMVQTSSDGRFAFRHLQPGSYRMFARYTLDGKGLVSHTIEFTDASPPSGVELRLAPAPEVTGTIAFDGGELPRVKRAVTLRPLDASGNLFGEIDQSQAFRIPGVFPGRYRVLIQPLPENAYVRSVEVDSAAGVPEDLEITGAARLKIAIGRNAAQVSGHVLDKDGARLENTLAAVVLIRDLKKFEISEESLARIAPDGSYSFKGLRPGKYWLLAFDAFRSRDFNSIEELKKHADLAEAVELKEGDRLRKELKIVTK